MYRFLLRPKWVVGQVLVVVLVVLFVNLGFWQLRRLDERRDRNAVIASRSDVPTVPVAQAISPSAGLEAADGVAYRRVSATGTYDAGAEVLVRSRSFEGRPGYHVLTPLVTGDGTALVVNRGFLPLSGDDLEAARRDARPSSGRVEVTGLLLTTQERDGIGPTDPAEGVLSEVARVDLGRLQRQYGLDLYPAYLQLDRQRPAQPSDLPVALPAPEQGEGSHLSYAGQWFLFATIGAVGWPLLVRRAAREQGLADVPPASGRSRSPEVQGRRKTEEERAPAAR